VDQKKEKKQKGVKKKAGKSLLSFGEEGEEEEEDVDGMAVKPKKAKFNTKLISINEDEEDLVSVTKKTNGTSSAAHAPDLSSRMDGRKVDEQHTLQQKPRMPSHRQRRSPSPVKPMSHSPTTQRRKPSFHDSTTQLPLKDPESPSNSPSLSPSPPPSRPAETSTSALNAEIAALKASMRRDIAPVMEPKRKKSALEEMIPSTSVRGRKRPRPGDAGAGIADAGTMKILDAFKAKLKGVDKDGDADMDIDIDMVDGETRKSGKTNGHLVENDPGAAGAAAAAVAAGNDDDEAALCDLHFIANCQSCSNWDRNGEGLDGDGGDEDENDVDWMKHALSFAKDRLGKDLTWKRKNEEELVVIDPRERAKEIKGKEKERRRGGGGGGR
jgi:peptidyl-prolyl cis-trans isomerase SDCCAG10